VASFTGFFAQQLVQFGDCVQQDTAALVNISRTNAYNKTGRMGQGPGDLFDYAPTAAATSVGILQPAADLTNLLSAGCSSGNCTFSDTDGAAFSSLAISHLCTDITSSIRIVNETQQNTSTGRYTAYLALDYEEDDYVNNNTYVWNQEDEGLVLRSWITQSTELTTVYFLFRSSNYEQNWRAANCSIFPTINTYAARINDGILEERLVDQILLKKISAQFKDPPVPDAFFDEFFFWTHMMTTNYTIRDGKRESCGGSDLPAFGLSRFMKHSDEPSYVNGTGYTNPSAGWKYWYFPEDCVWSLSLSSYFDLEDNLGDVFDDQNLMLDGRNDGVTGSVHLRVLFEQGNITHNSINERMRGLVTSITSIIRTNGVHSSVGSITGVSGFDDPLENLTVGVSQIAKGKMWITTTCVYIRWYWIAFPAVMIGLTGVFLLLVAMENRGIKNDRLWKSSFLAALFCEVEVHETPVGKQEMKAIAKSSSASLEGKSGRLRLVAG
jgi:hypothetical protein